MPIHACRLHHGFCGVFLLPLQLLAAPADTVTLPGIVVAGERRIDETPASIDRIDAGSVPARPGLSVSELLQRVPGIAAHDRQNLAQDVQVTIRGFGARTTFGVRGLRIFADGIPATMPDGQGQVSHIPLAAIVRVDVLRGPFSALYGNASGGVIEFFSADPPAAPEFAIDIATGSDDMRRIDLAWSGPWSAEGAGGYRFDAGRVDFGGYREHSHARRDIAQARMTADMASGTRIAVTANALNLQADDPQGLTFGQVLQTPRAASAGALAFDARKQVRQRQLGVRVEQLLGARNMVTLSAYAGNRATFQMLSVPVAAQGSPGSGGGVVDLDRGYSGFDLRWRGGATLAGRAASLTAGIELQRSSERRQGYENFVNDRLGVVGALRRDQRDSVDGRDLYLEARWQFAPRWDATLGLRNSRIDFRSRDRYIALGNPDDSGALRYVRTTPVAGLLFRPAPWLDLYANVGRGFETPSSSELAYRADGGSGLNTALRPARSDSAELGLRARQGEQRFTFAAFGSRTRDELVVAANLGGRSTYANAATTRRTGWELSASGPLARRWHYALAYTRLDARYRDGFRTCRAPPCAQPDTQINAGNRIPATTPQSAWMELRWSPRDDVDLFVTGTGSGRMYADDANQAHAPGHASFDLGVERRWHIGRVALQGFARVDNVLDRAVIGSVIVNDGNNRYFEPAPGRTWLLGLSFSMPPRE